jgi:HEAT repeats
MTNTHALNRFICPSLLLVILAMPTGVIAKTEIQAAPASSPQIKVMVDKQAKSAVSVNAKNATLRQILDELSSKSGALIHYSKLSDAPVSADCKGKDVIEVMACLVSKDFSLVAKPAEGNKPAEFWLVGTCESDCEATIAKSAIQQSDKDNSGDQSKVDQFMQEQSDLLLRQAQSKDPGERGLALYNLGLAGVKEDPKVDTVLRQAMQDKDPKIRAQAIGAIAQRGGENAFYDLGQALTDKDFNVRFNAVSGISDNVELLQQASNDSNKMVRDLAQSKLAELKSRQ